MGVLWLSAMCIGTRSRFDRVLAVYIDEWVLFSYYEVILVRGYDLS